MPKGLAQATAEVTSSPTDLRQGTVVAVTARGIDVAVTEGIVPDCAHLASYSPAVGDPVAMLRLRDSWLVLDRPVGPGTATDLASPGGASGATVLGGTTLSMTGTVMSTTTGSLVTVPRYRCTYYHPPGHNVMIMFGATYYATVANDMQEVAVVDAVSGAKVGSYVYTQYVNVSFSRYEHMSMPLGPNFGGRKVDLYVTHQRISGTGTSRVDDSIFNRGHLIAIDMGDKSLITTV